MGTKKWAKKRGGRVGRGGGERREGSRGGKGRKEEKKGQTRGRGKREDGRKTGQDRGTKEEIRGEGKKGAKRKGKMELEEGMKEEKGGGGNGVMDVEKEGEKFGKSSKQK